MTTSIRYWLEDMISAGARIVCFAVANPGKDIFLEMLEIELDLPSDRYIREVMEAEVQIIHNLEELTDDQTQLENHCAYNHCSNLWHWYWRLRTY